MTRVTFTGPELEGFTVEHPAASVRLLLSQPGKREVDIPTWAGNEFLLPDGQRATIRTFTPLRFDDEVLELDLDVVLHGKGAMFDWLGASSVGDPAAISGPGRGYAIDESAIDFLLAGDETAIPAISQLITSLPSHATVRAIIEIGLPDAELPMPFHPRVTVDWQLRGPNAAPGSALVPAVRNATVDIETRVWAAGEAAAMHQIRTHIFEELGMPRGMATVRGYWKHGRGLQNS
jgi:NADPH-dependent ferric siderophore reductase